MCNPSGELVTRDADVHLEDPRIHDVHNVIPLWMSRAQ